MKINMSISVSEEKIADKNWNDRLFKSGFGTIYQSKEISSHFEKIGKKPIFLKFLDNSGAIVGQLLVSKESRLEKKGRAGKFLKKLIPEKMLLYQWTYGPIIFEPELKDNVFECLEKFFLSKKGSISGWQHPLCANKFFSLKTDFSLKPWSTFLIDLTIPTDELYQNIDKHNGRKNIERSIRRNVIVEEIDEKSLEEYHQLRNDMRKEAGEELVDFEILLNWWKLFKPLGYSGFLAKNEDKPIGGLLFSYANDHIIEGGVARTEFDIKNKLYSQDLIKWKIIEWGIENNLKLYNLAGFNPQPSSKKEEGIFRYKKKWGGKRINYWILRRGINEK